jgi:hypothetical protein
MPIGSHHVETGWLTDDAGQLVLRRDGGGRWHLDVGLLTRWRARRLIGSRVRVEGIRDGFNVLSARTIGPC